MRPALRNMLVHGNNMRKTSNIYEFDLLSSAMLLSHCLLILSGYLTACDQIQDVALCKVHLWLPTWRWWHSKEENTLVFSVFLTRARGPGSTDIAYFILLFIFRFRSLLANGCAVKCSALFFLLVMSVVSLCVQLT